jgi:hypothetical protein
MPLAGGCLCGAIRYEIDPDPSDPADYCHCGQCRKATGAPVAAWIQVAPDRFRVVSGTARRFESSAAASRWFCAACGSPLYMTDAGGRSVGILLGTLDHPDEIRPALHGWTSARISWFDTRDRLPRFDGDPPYDR